MTDAKDAAKDTSAAAFALDAQGQEELLQEALRQARDHAFRMKRAMDAGELSAVLKHAADVLRELRTSLLSPKNYYQLYVQVLDELRHLEAFVQDLQTSGASMRALYERVQSSGNVLPRLYLLVTVGAVYIQSKEAPAKDILLDLVEMTKGVQHPLRGLFLRNYLAVSVKDKLPDAGSAFEGAGGSTDDAIAFLLQNFGETNRLWIRMQHTKAGIVKDKATREKERQDLRLLVGTSLVRLSQMEGMTARVYATQVLPKLLEIVVQCKDRLAQEYVMDCIIQVFPDDFHLQNLAELLAAIENLHDSVDCGAILVTLLERLLQYRQSLSDLTHMYGSDRATAAEKQDHVFTSVMDAVTNLTQHPARYAQAENVVSTVALFVTLTSFTLQCFNVDKGSVAYETRVANAAVAFLREYKTTLATTNATLQIEQIVQLYLERLSLPQLRTIDAVADMAKLLPWRTTRKRLVLDWIRSLVRRRERVASSEDAEVLLDFLAPLIRDDPDGSPLSSEPSSAAQKDEFETEQRELAKVVCLLQSDDLDVQFQMFSSARRCFGQGGVFRIRFTLVPLIFASLALARTLDALKASSPTYHTTPREVLQFVHEMVTALASKLEQMSVTCVSLFLQCALVADRCAFEAIAYEFITQAFIVYEDQITNSREQWKALELMVASVRATLHLSSTNYEVLATKTTQYAAKLLKKTDQAAMVLNCAHLFWHPNHKDGKRVLECLQRSLRIADAYGSGSSDGAASVTKVPLFLDILEAYLYFFEANAPAVSSNYITGLLALVKEHLENMEHGTTRSESGLRYRDIRRYIDSKALAV